MKKIPFLLTIDVHDLESVNFSVRESCKILYDSGIKATYMIPASVLNKNSNLIPVILDNGHQIGSHGLFHNRVPFNGYPPEKYNLLCDNDQKRFIEEATHIFVDLLGEVPCSFRSPCFALNGATIRNLESCGYKADLSVNSQRLDFLISSETFSFKNLFAPRLPYFPDRNDPYKKGHSGLWEIPVSSLIFPFAVMTLLTLGRRYMNWMTHYLKQESKETGKPLVYMCHAEEFNPKAPTYTLKLHELTLRDFLPIKGEGIRARQAMRIGDPKKIYENHMDYLKMLADDENLEFVTANEYVEKLAVTR